MRTFLKWACACELPVIAMGRTFATAYASGVSNEGGRMALDQPHQSLHQSKEEDITAVLGRFKAWNTGVDAQQEPETKAFAGLEEISYEEALGEVGRRRILARTASTRQVDLSSAIKAARDTVSLSIASQLQAKTDSAAVSTPLMADKLFETASASKVKEAIAMAAETALFTAGAGRPTKVAISREAAQPPQKKTAAVRTSASSRKKAGATMLAASPDSLPTKRTARPKTLTSPKAVGSTVNALLSSSARSQPTFKAVLEDRLANDRKPGSPTVAVRSSARATPVVSAKTSMVPWVESQSVSLKLRISAGEHATIKAGASEAGLPLAAYMRQCTLDVEVLRKLMKQTIADIRSLEPSAGQPLLAAPVRETGYTKSLRPGLLKRLKNAWLDRVPETGS